MYRTDSLPIASFLYSVDGVKFQGTEMGGVSGEKVFFLFDPDETANKLAKDYLSNQATVDPFVLFQSHHALKDIIFDSKRNIKK